MPSPREQPPSNRNRRRQDTMPGGWLWVVILLLLAGVMYFTLGFNNAGVIDYSEFMNLAKGRVVGKVKVKVNGKDVDEDKFESQFAKITIKGSTRMVGEIKTGELEKIPEAIKKQVRYNK